MEQSVWDRVREGFLMQHTGEGAKKGSEGSGVVERDMRSKAALGQEGKQVTARSSLCSWVLDGAEDTEGKALAALNESHREERQGHGNRMEGTKQGAVTVPGWAVSQG